MTLRRLKLLAILVPLGFLGALDFVRHSLYPDLLHAWPGSLLLGLLVLAGVLGFTHTLFRAVERMQARLGQQNRELLVLHQAGLAIASELDMETVLQRIVDQARELVGARYGALSLLDARGGIDTFLTSGLAAEQRAHIGALPEGRGLLDVVLCDGERLRLADLGRDPRSAGFPPHHPPMHSLLAVPIVTHARVLGNLYLTEKQGAAAFTAEEEETLVRFATQAALAIENARLHRQVKALAIAEERERLAHEMHDSLAQVLGYVNTKAQATRDLLRRGQPERAADHLGQLAEAARQAYADVREALLGLRTGLGVERGLLESLRAYVDQWQAQSGVSATLEVPTTWSTPLSATAELQLLRIIQEALANVRKHAEAHQARVLLHEEEGQVEAVVEDDGAGFDPAALGRGAFPRFGLATMRERAEAVGGTLEIQSAPGRGTRVSVQLPVTATNKSGGVYAGADR